MKSKFLIIIFIFGLSACQQKLFKAITAEAVDFSKFDTYAYLPNPDTTQHDVYNSEIIHYRSIVEINEELESRGLELDTANPDLLVVVNPMFRGIQENPYNNFSNYFAGPGYVYYYRGYFQKPEVSHIFFQEIEYAPGNLMIDMISTGSDQLVWRGWSNKTINANPLPEELDVYIARIFQKFPIKP